MSCPGDPEVARIQLNSAQQMVDTAVLNRDQKQADLRACLSPQEQSAQSAADAQPELQAAVKEAEELMYMNEFLLKGLRREVENEATYGQLGELAGSEERRIQEEIDRLKGEIRKEKRRFLDSAPSVSPAVAGLYFTKVPDNQVLIAFLSTFGAFLLFVGVLVLLGHVPLEYFALMTMRERVQVVAAFWVIALVGTYVSFFALT